MGYLNSLLTSAAVVAALYGCNNNNNNNKDSPTRSENAPEMPVIGEHIKYNLTKLEGKLMAVLRNAKGRFESSEMKREEQFDFYCNQLKQQEMIDVEAKCNNMSEMSKVDADKVLEVLVGSATKLKITDVTGLNHDYVVIPPETNLSDEAKQDLKAYSKFSLGLKDYLVETYGEGNPVLKEDLKNKVREYVSSYFDVSDSRKSVLAIYGYVDNMKNFNVLSGAKVAEQEIKTIRNILDNLKLE